VRSNAAHSSHGQFRRQANTCITPATSKPKHMLDNIGAAYGELPHAAALRKMEESVDALPSG